MNIEYDFWTMTMSCIIEDVEKIENFTADHILSLFLQRWIYHLLQEITQTKILSIHKSMLESLDS